jgi:hypothetical protein
MSKLVKVFINYTYVPQNSEKKTYKEKELQPSYSCVDSRLYWYS